MVTFLETERLALRPFDAAGDVEAVWELHNDREVMRFINGGAPTPRAAVRDEMGDRLLRRYVWPAEYGFWAAEERETGEFLGWFELRPTDGDGAAPVDCVELGYRLRTAVWGRGLATEGAHALVRTAFTELGVARVMATTMTVNAGSRRVMEKAGLRYVRTFHEDWPDPIEGAEHGDVEYELTAAEWRTNPPGR